MGNLKELKELSLANNELTGSLPIELTTLTALESFSLGINRFEGNIPESIGNLTALKSLDLGENSFTGPIPSSLGNLVNLRHLALNENQLSGDIPSELGNLWRINQILIVDNAELSGCFPDTLRGITYNDFAFTDLPFCEPVETNFVYQSDVYYIATIKTNKGDIVLHLYNDTAPVYVENFVNLTLSGFYDNSRWHRVEPGFVIQGGINPDGKTVRQFDDVFHPDMKHDSAGVLSMANAGINTNTSQFFITLGTFPRLDPYENGQLKPCHIRGTSCHAVFGKVTSGLDVVLDIEEGDVMNSIEIRRTKCIISEANFVYGRCFD